MPGSFFTVSSHEKIRAPAVAGFFYPNNPKELEAVIDGYLSQAKVQKQKIFPKAIIVPHAGYIYSGPIAASAYILLKNIRDKIRRVILLGPSHHVAFHGLALSGVDYFATPLGSVLLDHACQRDILAPPQVQIMDAAHAQEHSLEVHLPFLQKVLNDFTLVPIVVGDTTPSEVSNVLEKLWGGSETLIVISSDLSHYLNYHTAQKIDHETSEAVENLDPKKIMFDHACGRNPINGLLALACKKGLKVKRLDVRNSGDTAGDKDRVVGYGAWSFEE